MADKIAYIAQRVHSRTGKDILNVRVGDVVLIRDHSLKSKILLPVTEVQREFVPRKASPPARSEK